jgi:phosphoribosylanthranilate isomerase
MKKTLIKVCGITDINDMKYASNIEDIDYLGIIFAKESPRCVDLNLAEKLINACDKTKNIVAVFMNQSKDDIEDVIKNLDFNILQFHGHESVDFCNFFKKPFIKTFHIENQKLNIDINFIKYAHAFLLDTSSGNSYGGTGKTFDWEILNENKFCNDTDLSLPYLTAGGLNPSNIKDLISKYGPPGVDVSSGIESSVGKKDHLLMKKFIENVRISELENYEKD